MQQQSSFLDLTAKVLAAENIQVVRRQVRTASFDLKDRVLTLPMWQGITLEIEDLQVCHEVGHALFTSDEYIEACSKHPARRATYNVVEDIRIERLVRERFPGTRKVFGEGRRAILNGGHLDGMKVGTTVTADDTHLADRLNLEFKYGAYVTVKFLPEEYQYVARARTIVTIDEAIKLADDVYAYMVAQREQPKEQERRTETWAQGGDEEMMILVQAEQGEEQDEGEEQAGGAEATPERDDTDRNDEVTEPLREGDKEQAEQGDDSSTPTSGGTDDEEQAKQGDEEQAKQGDESADEGEEPVIESATESALNQALQRMTEAAEKMYPPKYLTIDDRYDSKMVLTYKEILEYFEPDYRYDPMDKFLAATMPGVTHMSQLFRMRKAANIRSLRQVAKTGRIDPSKLAMYKLKDDIFLRRMTVPEGKNHAVVMLLDWSGSMAKNYVDQRSMVQVVQMVMFCRQVGIPYRVLAFTAGRHIKIADTDKARNHGAEDFTLLELFSDQMTVREHTLMMHIAITPMKLRREFRMSTTPLAPALAYMRKYLPEFRRQYQVEKLNLVVYTDGANTDEVAMDRSALGELYLQDQVTKKNYLVSSEYNAECNTWYQLLRERTGCIVTTYHVEGNRASTIYASLRESGVHIDLAEAANMAPKYKEDRFIKVTGHGRDAHFVIREDLLRTDEWDFDQNSALNANSSRAEFTKALKRASRNVLKGKVLIENLAAVIS